MTIKIYINNLREYKDLGSDYPHDPISTISVTLDQTSLFGGESFTELYVPPIHN